MKRTLYSVSLRYLLAHLTPKTTKKFMKIYTIKLEDKAALINTLKSINIGIDSFNIVDNVQDKSFDITFKKEQDEEAAKDILKTHKGINQLEELLRRIIHEEFKR
jgi:hypothetical protein